MTDYRLHCLNNYDSVYFILNFTLKFVCLYNKMLRTFGVYNVYICVHVYTYTYAYYESIFTIK